MITRQGNIQREKFYNQDIELQGGAISIGTSNLVSASKTLAASSVLNATNNSLFATTTPNDDLRLSLLFLMPMISFYIDNDNVGAYLFPRGSSLTSGQLKMRLGTWIDLAGSQATNDNGTGVQFRVWMENWDGSPHTVYLYYNIRVLSGVT